MPGCERTSTTITHRLGETGVTLLVRDGTVVRPIAVSDGDARRLAWSLLADLEPDDGPSPLAASSRPGRRGDAPVRQAILTALRDETGTRHEVTKRAGVLITSNALHVACERGIIERVGGHRRGNVLAVYAITPLGVAELQRMRATDRVQA